MVTIPFSSVVVATRLKEHKWILCTTIPCNYRIITRIVVFISISLSIVISKPSRRCCFLVAFSSSANSHITNMVCCAARGNPSEPLPFFTLWSCGSESTWVEFTFGRCGCCRVFSVWRDHSRTRHGRLIRLSQSRHYQLACH